MNLAHLQQSPSVCHPRVSGNVSVLVLTNDKIRVHDIQRCVNITLSVSARPQGKWKGTFEVHFWPEKQQKGHAFDQPRSLLPLFVIENGLFGAEASLALAEEVDVPSMGYKRSGSSRR